MLIKLEINNFQSSVLWQATKFYIRFSFYGCGFGRRGFSSVPHLLERVPPWLLEFSRIKTWQGCRRFFCGISCVRNGAEKKESATPRGGNIVALYTNLCCVLLKSFSFFFSPFF